MTLTIARAAATCRPRATRAPRPRSGSSRSTPIFSPVRRVAVPRRRRPRRAANRLRQAHASTSRPNGSVDPRKARRAGRRDPDRAALRSSPTSTRRSSGRDDARRGRGGEAEAPQAHGMENILIEELELGVRSYNCLKRVGIETIGDLIVQDRAGAGRDPELRQEVDRGGQGDARRARPVTCGATSREAPAARAANSAATARTARRCSRTYRRARRARPHQDHRWPRPRRCGRSPSSMITLAASAATCTRSARRWRSCAASDAVHRLFAEVAPRYTERPGGYTRIVKLGPRQGDARRDGVHRAGRLTAGVRRGR